MTQLHELLPGIYCIEVPMKACDIQIHKDHLFGLPHPGMSVHKTFHKLPAGHWSIICCSATATEEEAAKVVDTPNTRGKYKCYHLEGTSYVQYGSYFIDTATESLASLIRSKGLDDKLNWLFLKLD